MKDIKTFENLYQISENGIVKALERKVNMTVQNMVNAIL